jgi:hypothetical protein
LWILSTISCFWDASVPCLTAVLTNGMSEGSWIATLCAKNKHTPSRASFVID